MEELFSDELFVSNTFDYYMVFNFKEKIFLGVLKCTRDSTLRDTTRDTTFLSYRLRLFCLYVLFLFISSFYPIPLEFLLDAMNLNGIVDGFFFILFIVTLDGHFVLFTYYRF